jgi:hypothetical protein
MRIIGRLTVNLRNAMNISLIAELFKVVLLQQDPVIIRKVGQHYAIR